VFRKFVDGLAFGAGLAISFVAASCLAMYFVLPRVMGPPVTETSIPKFAKPEDAQVVTPDPRAPAKARDFSFFRHSADRMAIPPRGGILAMAPVTTPSGATRPTTYQLWLTEAGLWQIRTIEDKAQVERLPRPEGASVGDLDRLMREKLGSMARQSTMTVSEVDVQTLRSSGTSSRDATLNGKLSVTVDGIVFLLPNPY
jgi:hypothetical protein